MSAVLLANLLFVIGIVVLILALRHWLQHPGKKKKNSSNM